MKLIIDIPDGAYEEICRARFPIQDGYRLVTWIKDGTPLPKGHGRLIDADALEELFGKKCVGDCGCCMTKRKTDGSGKYYDTCSLIDVASTIIEADKEDSDADSN